MGGGAVTGGVAGLANHVTSAAVSQSQIQPNFAAAAAAQQNGEFISVGISSSNNFGKSAIEIYLHAIVLILPELIALVIAN